MVDFSKHIQKAEEALRRRNYDFAIEVFRGLLDVDPDQGEARAGLRVAYKKKQESKRGGKFLRALGGAVPLATAKTMAKAGKYQAAAKQLETYLGQNPLDVEGNLLLGQCLEGSSHFKSARAVYEFLAEIAPKHSEGLKRAGAMMQRAGDPVKALEYYQRALDADPRDQEAIKARKDLSAETALQSGGYEDARHSRDLIRDKEAATRLERSKRMHRTEEDLRAELEELEERFTSDSTNPDLMLEIASLYEKLKDPAAALEFVDRALSYRKDSFDLMTRSGELRGKVIKRKLARADKLGDSEEAERLERELFEHEIADFARRVELHPGDAPLRSQYARRLMRAERLDEALAEFQKAQDDPRVRGDAVFFMAQCFERKGFNDLAQAEYEKALEGIQGVDDRAKEILYSLGSIAESQDRREEAGAFYARVYQVDIGYRDVAAKMEQFK